MSESVMVGGWVRETGPTDHGDALGHVVHAVGSVGPGLNDDGGVVGQGEGGDGLLDGRVGETGELGLAHVFGVDVAVAAVEGVVGDDLVPTKLDLELGEDLVDIGVDHGDAGRRLWLVPGEAVLVVEVGHHGGLGGLLEGDDPEEDGLVTDMATHDGGGLIDGQNMSVRGG